MSMTSDVLKWFSRKGAPWRAFQETPRRAPESVVTPAQRPPAALVIDALSDLTRDQQAEWRRIPHHDNDARALSWLLAASRVAGTLVFDAEGNENGQIRDLSIDKKSGRVVYALVSFGGAMGTPEHYHPLPWSLLSYDVEKDAYVVPFDAATIERLPSLEPNELKWFETGDIDWRSKLAAQYGAFYTMPFI